MPSHSGSFDLSRERRRTIVTRCLFAAVLAVLPVQYLVRHKLGEPYPSFVMPSFAGDNTVNGRIQIQSVDIQLLFCDRDSITVSPDQFFNTLPHSHVMAVMRWMFGPGTYNPRPISHWKTWIFALSPGYYKQVLRVQGASPIDNSAKQWLLHRVASEYGDQPAILCTLWYSDTYDMKGVSPIHSRRLTAVVPVRLSSCTH